MTKSFKKSLALILSIVMIIGVMPMGLSFAAESDYTYTVTDEKATITKYSGSEEELIIPDTLGGYPVVAIGEKAFRDNLSIKKIKFADSIETVGNLAFYKCQSLVEVNLGNGVKILDGAVFSNCQTIDTVIIGKSLTSIGTGAFNGTTVNKILYKGSEAEWAAISIGESNNRFTSAEKVFNYCEHVSKEMPEVPAECEKTGLTKGECCALCGEVFVAQKEIPALGHDYKVDEEKSVKPECEKEGLEVTVCSNCGDVKELRIKKLGHKKETIDVLDPTCNEPGKTGAVICRVCNSVFVANTEIPATGHTVEILEAVPATCENTGLTEGKKCTVCNETLVAQQDIPALGHDYKVDEEKSYAAECEKEGLEVTVCSNCGDEKEKRIKKLGHKKETIDAVDPTCTEPGKTGAVICRVCNCVFAVNTDIPALGHKEETIPAVPATCTETGYTEGKKCSVCGVTTKEPQLVKANGHKAGEAVKENEVASTCTVAGSYESVVYCSVCEEELSSETVALELAAHTAGEVVVENEIDATCEGNGSYQNVSYCTACNAEVSREKVTVEALGHKASEAVKENEVAATCTEAGKYDSVVYCSVCNKKISSETVVVEALDHDYVIDENASTLATCSDAGTTVKVCSRCGHTKYEPVNSLGHNEITVEAKDPTCTEDGHNAYVYCDRAGCGYSTLKVIESTGHISGAPATCTEDQVCTVCNEVIVSAKGHTEVTLAAEAPTCTAEGKKEGKACSTCKKVLVPQEIIPALGHNYIKDEARSKDAKCTDAGVYIAICDNCDHEKIETINPLGHDIVEHEGEAATCTEAGFKAYVTCNICDYTTYEAITAPGHTAGAAATCTEDQICTVCDYVIASKLGHNVVTISGKAPSCTVKGYTEGEYCDRCNVVLKEQFDIPAPGHTPVKVEGEAADCTTDGLTDGSVCSGCGTVLIAQVVIPATGHKEVVIEAVAPTCTKSGSTAGAKCETCGEIFDEPMYIKPYGHNAVTVKGYEATCTEAGLTDGKQCSRCGKFTVKQEEIPMKKHTLMVIHRLEPTCTEAGYTVGQKCTTCGVFTLVPQEIPATGHTYGPAATCTKPQICTVCGDVLAEALGHTPGAAATCTAPQTCTVCSAIITPMLPHDLEYDMTVTKPATCYSDGYEKAECKNCDYGYGKKIPAFGHNVQFWTTIEFPTCYEEGKAVGLCVNCKYEQEKILPALEHKDDDGNKKCDYCKASLGGGIVIPGGDKEEDKEDEDKCSCNCHAIGIRGLIFDFILFLQRLFGLNKTCKCGEAHY